MVTVTPGSVLPSEVMMPASDDRVPVPCAKADAPISRARQRTNTKRCENFIGSPSFIGPLGFGRLFCTIRPDCVPRPSFLVTCKLGLGLTALDVCRALCADSKVWGNRFRKLTRRGRAGLLFCVLRRGGGGRRG